MYWPSRNWWLNCDWLKCGCPGSAGKNNQQSSTFMKTNSLKSYVPWPRSEMAFIQTTEKEMRKHGIGGRRGTRLPVAFCTSQVFHHRFVPNLQNSVHTNNFYPWRLHTLLRHAEEDWDVTARVSSVHRGWVQGGGFHALTVMTQSRRTRVGAERQGD